MPRGRGIQFFPFENWENEFYSAAELGLDEIEFIFDYERYEENPLFSKDGIKKINEIVKSTSVKVNSICFDYFMRRPFYKVEKEIAGTLRKENVELIKRIAVACMDVGAHILEVPVVDNSSIKTWDEKERFIDFMYEITEQSGIIFNIESDFEPIAFKSLLDAVGLQNIRANYDSGNSSGLGYDQYEEVTTLCEYITNVHIKDRKYKGASMPLGEGDADFDRLFSGLREIDYTGSYILQAARGKDGSEKENTANQISFLKRYL